MTFVIAPECVQLGLRAGAVIFRGIRVAAAGPALRAEIAAEIAGLRARFPNPGAVRQSPDVGRFHELLRKVGVNPHRERPSLERLLSFALKRGDLPTVNSLVDAYNLVSVRWGCSLGAHDLDLIAPPVTLRLLSGRETFTPLGREVPEPVVVGEFGYVDARDRVLCRLDLLQADFSKVTERTTNALLIIEATATHPLEALHGAFADALKCIPRHCGGTAEIIALPSP